jgi:hypothetical protein
MRAEINHDLLRCKISGIVKWELFFTIRDERLKILIIGHQELLCFLFPEARPKVQRTPLETPWETPSEAPFYSFAFEIMDDFIPYALTGGKSKPRDSLYPSFPIDLINHAQQPIKGG